MANFIRLQKFLACAGIASRRKCETLIQEGRVEVNHSAAISPGTKIDPEKDEVRCDGEVIQPEKKIYLLLNKPKGLVCSSEPQGNKTIFELVKGFSQRLFCVGRLDKDSEGLLILTNDGDLTAKCTHPKYGISKTYRAVVAGRISGGQKGALSKGAFTSDGKMTLPDTRVIETRPQQTELEVVLREGRNRHIRRVLEARGFKVKKLTRVAIGSIRLECLPKGKWRKLSQDEIKSLRKEA